MRSDAGCGLIGTSFRAQHDRHLARLVNERQVLDGIQPSLAQRSTARAVLLHNPFLTSLAPFQTSSLFRATH